MKPPPRFDVVIPTVGRPSLVRLLTALSRCAPSGARLIVVDDRAGGAPPLDLPADPRVELLRSEGRGPAAARNAGWRASRAPWVVFLDDDVDITLGWVRQVEGDIRRAGLTVGAVQGRLRVPLPPHRPASDWERNVGGLERAPWITADLAVRRGALEAVGGFDERFPRAYREDSDLALRLLDHGWQLTEGERQARHPVRPAPWWVSVALQRGNADDVLLERKHGDGWRDRLGAPRGTFRSHRTTVLAGAGGLLAVAARRRGLAAGLTAVWAWRTGRLAWSRIAPGPRTPAEVTAMALTSVAIPPAACFHRWRGQLRWRATGTGQPAPDPGGTSADAGGAPARAGEQAGNAGEAAAGAGEQAGHAA